MKTLTIKDLSSTEELDTAEMAAVHGGVSLYVDGVYRGEQNLSLDHSPGRGAPTYNVWSDGTRTPYFG
jgi:hypothetical protein